MPFAQVTEDQNGQKVLTPITDSTSTTAADALALAQAALPKAGGEMTGPVTVPAVRIRSAASVTEIPASLVSSGVYIVDDQNNTLAQFSVNARANGSHDAAMRVVGLDGATATSLSNVIDADGTTYATCSTPLATAPNNAIQTKESVARDYLSKNGGEMTGNLTIDTNSASVTLKYNQLERGVAPASTNYYPQINYLDKNGVKLGQVFRTNNADGNSAQSLVCYSEKDGTQITSTVAAHIDADGTTYATFPHPRPDNYGTDGVTAKAMKDWAAMKSAIAVNTYLGGANASDTAGLFQGRGLSADMPFASLQALINWAQANYLTSAEVNINVQEDIEIGSVRIVNPGISRFIIKSSATDKKTLTIGNGGVINNQHGALTFKDIKLHAEDASSFLMADGRYGDSLIRIDSGVELSGTVTASAINVDGPGAKIYIESALTGTVTGKKYQAVNGGKIISRGTAIPGTIDGTCDATSVYA